jgi:Ca-activated chloride channel family protein
MTFETPLALLALLLIPVVLLGYMVVQGRREKYAVRFTNLDLLANVAHGAPGWRRHLPPVLYVVALFALVVSLARPHAIVLVPKEQATVMLVMDVSGSMEATDVAPSRLVAAKSAALDFLDQLPSSVRVGLISFSSSVQTLAAPTADRAQIRSALGLLRSSGGTAMGDGLVRALEIQIASDAAPPATPLPSASPGIEPRLSSASPSTRSPSAHPAARSPHRPAAAARCRPSTFRRISTRSSRSPR